MADMEEARPAYQPSIDAVAASAANAATNAAMGERVTNLNRRQSDLEVEMRSGFRQIEQSFTSFTNETRLAINALSSNLADRNKPQWQAIGVAITFVALIGALVYWPVREATADLKTAVAMVAEKMVTRDELDWRSARSLEDRVRTEAAITDIRAGLVPRTELDQRFADFQRQLDGLKPRSRF